MDGLGGQLPTQVLADQVILSQPEIVPPTLLLAHPAYLQCPRADKYAISLYVQVQKLWYVNKVIFRLQVT